MVGFASETLTHYHKIGVNPSTGYIPEKTYDCSSISELALNS